MNYWHHQHQHTAVTYHSSWHVSLRNSRRTGRGNVVAHACTRYSRQLQRGIYGTQIKRRFGVYHPVITVTVVFNSWQLLAWLMHHNRSHRLYRYIYSTYIYTNIHIYMYTYICIYMHTYINIHIYIHVHIYIQTYTHTYMHTYIHTYNRSCSTRALTTEQLQAMREE